MEGFHRGETTGGHGRESRQTAPDLETDSIGNHWTDTAVKPGLPKLGPIDRMSACHRLRNDIFVKTGPQVAKVTLGHILRFRHPRRPDIAVAGACIFPVMAGEITVLRFSAHQNGPVGIGRSNTTVASPVQICAMINVHAGARIAHLKTWLQDLWRMTPRLRITVRFPCYRNVPHFPKDEIAVWRL